MDNPWFRDVQFRPAKGEILTLRVPGLFESRVVHRGIWLAPIGGDLFQAGSTYEWKQLDVLPTSRGRNEIESQLRDLLRLPFEVVSHKAAVRPIHRNQYPVVGRHPRHPQLGYFNGLGSKGSLCAPYFANQLVHHLDGGGPLEPEVDLNRKTSRRTSPSGVPVEPENARVTARDIERVPRSSLTQQAQERIREVLTVGDVAIDATAGNGHDTNFLAETVGSQGTVFAFDIQQLALDKTAERLASKGLKNVVLAKHDHGEMQAVIPREHHGNFAAAMFNLGYLPGGDKTLTTGQESTRSGILAACALLRTGGVLTIIVYTGHAGGAAEAEMVGEILDGLSRLTFDVETVESERGQAAGPRLFVVKRRPE